MNRQSRINTSLAILIGTYLALTIISLLGKSQILEAQYTYTLTTELENYLLQCRRQEKNFIIRSDMRSIELFRMNLDSCKMLVAVLSQRTHDTISRNSLSQLGSYLDDYYKAYRVMVLTRRDTRNMEALIPSIHQCTEASNNCHEIIESVRMTEKERYHVRKGVWDRLTVIFGAIAGIVTILSVVVISRDVYVLWGLSLKNP